ncbi:MAG: hypothetical protein M0D53_04145 [Flavobacterium sp. JAD_PAG50586_2]|nr:MAG: hypothetical protein M0D53_04145 [Flavobacterium sp. JAD_PAG50586_2]
MKIFFSDFFDVTPQKLSEYGAFNISLLKDLPLFIDPFLLFGSSKDVYQAEHKKILQYLEFLKIKSENRHSNPVSLKGWYQFKEVKQNWFGFSKIGNSGSGLGPKFSKAFSSNISSVFDDLGNEEVTKTSHLEKTLLFEIGVGKDHISDFSTNLLKNFLLEYTMNFASKEIDTKYLREFKVDKVYFDYNLEKWMPKEFLLPYFRGDYVLLTPRDILTKDDNWISSKDLYGDFHKICSSISNDQIREEISNYFIKKLPSKKPNEKHLQSEKIKAIKETIKKFPEIIKVFVGQKEKNIRQAQLNAEAKVESLEFFIKNVISFVELVVETSEFYEIPAQSSFEEALKRVNFLKKVIENNDGYKLFYLNGEPIKRESDLQILYKLTWFASEYDVNREPNNGRGPADYTVSMGAEDKTVIEFKLASNTKLKQNLESQVEVYKEANGTTNSITVIMYFNAIELQKVSSILNQLEIKRPEEFIILIDAGKKKSASNVKM